jgi:hypothetical protein
MQGKSPPIVDPIGDMVRLIEVCKVGGSRLVILYSALDERHESWYCLKPNGGLVPPSVCWLAGELSHLVLGAKPNA